MTIRVNGRRIDAVVQLTKQGFAYVFDRVTGRPVWPIEERPVPQSDVPGEQSSPTQPFPTAPPPFTPQGVTLDDAFDLTPELKAAAQAEMKKFRLGPLYTPPSMEGTLVRPGVWGGANWGGGAFDPETGMLYLKTVGLPQVFRIQKRDPTAPTNRPGEVDADYVNRGLSGYFMEALPLTKPPYAHLVAIDLNKGTIAWREPFGDLPAVREAIEKLGVKPPEKLGAQGPPGLVVTKSGLHLRRRRRPRLPRRRCRDRQGSVVGGDAGNDRDADDLRGRRPAVRGRRDRAGIRGHAGRLRAAAISRRTERAILAATRHRRRFALRVRSRAGPDGLTPYRTRATGARPPCVPPTARSARSCSPPGPARSRSPAAQLPRSRQRAPGTGT